MVKVKNAVEDVVLNEARLQWEALRADVKQRIDLREVVAYALNRLPPMYASSQNGWVEQRNRARSELGLEIASAVRRGIHIVQFGDPLHDHTPLPSTEFNSEAKSLLKLRQILGRSNMRWRDVPAAVEAEIARKAQEETAIVQEETVIQEEDGGLVSKSRRSAIYGIKAYLQRTKQRTKLETDALKNKPASNWASQVKEVDRLAIEHEELESHVLKEQLGLSNVLEKIVVLVVQHSTRNLKPELKARIKLEEIVAYALNRLPAMYATSARGYKYLRQRAQTELSREILARAREGFLKVVSDPRPFAKPLPFEKFHQEQEEALTQLKKILKRQDITCENVAAAIESVLNPEG